MSCAHHTRCRALSQYPILAFQKRCPSTKSTKKPLKLAMGLSGGIFGDLCDRARSRPENQSAGSTASNSNSRQLFGPGYGEILFAITWPQWWKAGWISCFVIKSRRLNGANVTQLDDAIAAIKQVARRFCDHPRGRGRHRLGWRDITPCLCSGKSTPLTPMVPATCSQVPSVCAIARRE